jgi:signal peptidase I
MAADGPQTTPDPNAGTSPAAPSKRSDRGPARTVAELIATVAAAIGLAVLIQALVVKPYKIPSGSMLPTVQIGQRILANRLDTHPQVGDIVVFHPPAGADPQPAICGSKTEGTGYREACDQPTRQESEQTFIKRVVGLPGDRISIVDGHVIRNGTPEPAPYAQPCQDLPGCTFATTITVPRGDYYMMGDNRPQSDDSRFWGPVPQSWIIGVAVLTYWPLNRLGTI